MRQSRKHPLAIVAMDEGIKIDRNAPQTKNATSPRVKSFEPGSRVKVDRVSQSWKQEFAIVSTDEECKSIEAMNSEKIPIRRESVSAKQRENTTNEKRNFSTSQKFRAGVARQSRQGLTILQTGVLAAQFERQSQKCCAAFEARFGNCFY
jgi:hypothetical protein